MLKFLMQMMQSLTKVNANLATEVDFILEAAGGLKNINYAAACTTRNQSKLGSNLTRKA